MIRAEDLEEAIAECQGERNPNANTCIKLAAFYTILNELYGRSDPPQYSYAPAPAEAPRFTIDSGTDFARAVDGKDPAQVMAVMDELMSTIEAFHPRLYRATMRELDEL